MNKLSDCIFIIIYCSKVKYLTIVLNTNQRVRNLKFRTLVSRNVKSCTRVSCNNIIEMRKLRLNYIPYSIGLWPHT